MARIVEIGALTGDTPVLASDGSRPVRQAANRQEATQAERMAAATPVEPPLPDGLEPAAVVEDGPPPDPVQLQADATPRAEAMAEPLFSPVVVAQAFLSTPLEFMSALGATAMGDGPATDGDGNRFVRLLRITESVDPLSYAHPHGALTAVLSHDPVGEPAAAPVPVFVASVLLTVLSPVAPPVPVDPPPAAPPPVDSPVPADPLPAAPPAVDPPAPVDPPPPDLRGAQLEVDEAAVAGGNGAGSSSLGASATGLVWSGATSGTLSEVRIGVAGAFAPIELPAHGSVSIAFDRDGEPIGAGSAQPAAARLDVDAAGHYTFTVLSALNHEPVQGSNSLLLPQIVHLVGTDEQGVSTVVDLSLVLRDDVPVLRAGGPGEVAHLDEHDLLAQPGTALVLHGDVRDQASWGADGFGHVTGLSWDGGTAAVAAGAAGATLHFDPHGQMQAGPDGAAASLGIQGDGGYTFTLERSLLVAGAQRNIVSLLGDGFNLSAQDGDGDLVSGIRLRIEIGDDIPSLSAGAITTTGLALTTHDALTAGAASDSATADFSMAFGSAVHADYGADGPGAVELGGWALQLERTDSGLTSGGQAVSLSQEGSGAIIGATAAGTVFRLSVDDSGQVTLRQFEALDHGGAGTSLTLGPGLLRLGATATVSDADQDQATTVLATDLGGLIRFEGEAGSGGPTAQLRLPTGSDETGDSNDRVFDYPPHALGLDESPLDDPGTAMPDGNGWSSRSEDFSVYFHSDRGRGTDAASSDAVDYGVDGKGDIRFSLGLTATDAAGQVSAVDGIGSGIHALDPGSSGPGPEILLYRVDDSTIEGRLGSASYFTLHVDAATGMVEFARGGAGIWNPVAGDGDDRAILLGADAALTSGGHTLVLTQTVSDADGSTSSVSAHLAGYGVDALPLALAPDLFSIADDAPVAAGLQLMLGGAGSVERHIGAEVGADGGRIQSISVDGVSYDDQGASAGSAGHWNAATKTWDIQTSGGATLTVDMDGDPANPQDHGAFRYSTPVDAGQVESFDYTLVDGDGDTSSATLTVSVGSDTVFGNAESEVLVAAGGERTLFGANGNDTLLGGAGADTLHGGNGSDVLNGGAGDDLIDGGSNPALSFSNNYAGGDTASYADAVPVAGTQGVTVSLAVSGPQDTRAAGTDTLVGIEHLLGSAYDDRLSGDDGRNRLAGGAGNDSLFGGAGSDTLSGGTGVDVLLGEGDGDSLLGGAGDDLLDGGEGDDTLDGQAGADILYGGDGNDLLAGGEGDDLLDGGSGDDRLSGNAGADSLHGGDGDDVLTGGTGDDFLDGGANGVAGDTASYSDAVPGPGRSGVTVSLALSGPQDTGTAGRDTLVGIENLLGSDYDDVLSGNDAANRLSGGAGNDTLHGGGGDDWLQGQVGADVLTGGDGNDTLDGGRGNDTLLGGAGDDVLTGGAGNDLLDGGSNGVGGDSASYDADTLTQGVTVSLALSGPQDTGSRGLDTLVNIENLTGSRLDDRLSGNDGANRLNGLSGDDTLNGGAGSDTLTGGAGADVFVWRLADRDASTDHVADFNPVAGDVLDLRELLDGEHGGSDFNLAQYLRFDSSGPALTLAIDHDGGSAFVAQQAIVFDNLADRQALAAVLGSADDDMAVIHKMISSGSLNVDA